MITIRKYQKGDIQQVLVTNVDRFVTRYISEESFMKSASFTGLDINNKIVGCAGLTEWWDGVYEAWLAIDENSKQDLGKIIGIVRTLKKSIDDGMKGGIRRVSAYVNVQIPNHEHFMKFLGFEPEATLKEYFPNRIDAILYRRMSKCP